MSGTVGELLQRLWEQSSRGATSLLVMSDLARMLASRRGRECDKRLLAYTEALRQELGALRGDIEQMREEL